MRLGTDIRRCVASYAGNGNGSTWEDRPGMHAPYIGGATIKVGNGLESWTSSSDQRSTMNGSTMTFEGNASALAIGVPLSPILTSQGQSKFDVRFVVTAPTDFQLTGYVQENGHADSQAIVRLTDTNGAVVAEAISSANSSNDFALNGTLPPGNYRLYAESTGRSRTGPIIFISNGSSSCAFEFNTGAPVYHPADWNLDHFVNSDDFYAFIHDFLRGDADFNHSGSTDSSDFFDFMRVFMIAG